MDSALAPSTHTYQTGDITSITDIRPGMAADPADVASDFASTSLGHVAGQADVVGIADQVMLQTVAVLLLLQQQLFPCQASPTGEGCGCFALILRILSVYCSCILLLTISNRRNLSGC